MKIDGKEWEGKALPLNVAALKKFIAEYEAKVGNIDEYFIHFLDMEAHQDGEHAGYVTHVDVDCFDVDTGDPDDPDCKPVMVLGLSHWPNQERDMASLSKCLLEDES